MPETLADAVRRLCAPKPIAAKSALEVPKGAQTIAEAVHSLCAPIGDASKARAHYAMKIVKL